METECYVDQTNVLATLWVYCISWLLPFVRNYHHFDISQWIGCVYVALLLFIFVNFGLQLRLFFFPFALTVHSMLVAQHTEINFHLGAWWIIIAIFRCLGLYILRCFYFLCTWFLYSRLIKKSFPLTMAISIVCRASLGIFGEVLFIEISGVNDTHTHTNQSMPVQHQWMPSKWIHEWKINIVQKWIHSMG